MRQEPVNESTSFFFWKGRVALYAILKALRVGVGDEVIVPGFTCVVVPQAVRFAGARPIYVDIEERTLNLDPKQLSSLISNKTKAIIVQHTFGLPADMNAVRSIAAPKGINIIEDCAHAMSSLYQNRRVGQFGEAAFFSTQWSKPVTTGLGGIAVSNDAKLTKRLLAFHQECRRPSWRESMALFGQFHIHRMFFKPSIYWRARSVLHMLSRIGLFVGSSSAEELNGEKPDGYEKQMAVIQIRLLKEAMAEIDVNSAHRKYVVRRYSEAVERIGLQTVTIPRDADPVLLRFPVLVPHKNKILEEARKQRIEMGDWFVSPLHPLTEGWKLLEYTPGECPVGESAARRVINLPTHLKVDDRTIHKTCDFLERI